MGSDRATLAAIRTEAWRAKDNRCQKETVTRPGLIVNKRRSCSIGSAIENCGKHWKATLRAAWTFTAFDRKGMRMNIIERTINDITVLDLEGNLALDENARFRKHVTGAIDAGARKLIVNLAR